jgi:hypothetical protein
MSKHVYIVRAGEPEGGYEVILGAWRTMSLADYQWERLQETRYADYCFIDVVELNNDRAEEMGLYAEES